MRQKLIAVILFAAFQSGQDVNAQNDKEAYVYMVRIPQTANHPPTIQTGFRLKGTKGIITTLHGVVGAANFTAFNESGDILKNLKIEEVDIENDVAILRSAELDHRNDEGLIEGVYSELSSDTRYKVFGHPVGINLYSKSVNIGSPVYKELHQLVPPASGQLFNNRKSPDPKISVINIEGSLVSGNSGSPLLNSDFKVFGVVDGGILDGAAGISWAIPLKKINWQNISVVQDRLSGLSSLSTKNLFSFEINSNLRTGKTISQNGNADYSTLSDALAESIIGDTLFIENGNYKGDPQILKSSVNLIGKGNQIIMPKIRIIKGVKTSIQNLTFPEPVQVTEGFAEIRNCNLYGGISLLDGYLNLEHSNLVKGTDLYKGINVSSSILNVSDCAIKGWGCGIYVTANSTATISDSRFSDNKIGVTVVYKGVATVGNSSFTKTDKPFDRPKSRLGAGSEYTGIINETNNTFNP